MKNLKIFMAFGILCLSFFSFADETKTEEEKTLSRLNNSVDSATKKCGKNPSRKDFRKHHKRIAEIYGKKAFSADTMWCHHLNKEGKHIVLNNLSREEANHCCGVHYSKITKLECGKARKDGAHHNACTAAKCPFIRDGVPCPYTKDFKKMNHKCDGE